LYAKKGFSGDASVAVAITIPKLPIGKETTIALNVERAKAKAEANSEHWEVYIIETTSGKLYTGITTNLDRRLNDHMQQRKGAKFFRFSSPKSIVFRESLKSKSEALKREYAIKQLTRSEKLKLINNEA